MQTSLNRVRPALLAGYNATDRSKVMRYLEQQKAMGEVVTGLLYIHAANPFTEGRFTANKSSRKPPILIANIKVKAYSF